MIVVFVSEGGVRRDDADVLSVNAHGVVGVKELSDTKVGDFGFAIAPIGGALARIQKMEHAIAEVLFCEIAFGSVGAVIGFG